MPMSSFTLGNATFDMQIAASPDGGRFAIRSYNGPVEIWNWYSTQAATELSDAGGGDGLDWSPDDRHVAVRIRTEVVLFNPADGSKVRQLSPGLGSDYRCLRFSPDGHMLVIADTKKVQLREVESGRKQTEFSQALDEVRVRIAWLRDNQWLVVSPDGHYRCAPGVEKLLSCFLLLDDGSQTMLTPAEFEQRFGWKNDPSQVPHLPGME